MDIDDVLARTQCDLFWLPEGVRVVDRPEILYVASPREQGYLNAVLRLNADDAQMPALVDEVVAAHQGVASRWMLMGASRRPGVEGPLRNAGYRPEHEHFGYALRVHGYEARRVAGLEARPIATETDLRAAIEVTSRAFGRTEHVDDARLADELDKCTRPDRRVHRFVVWDTTTREAVCAGGLTAFPALRFGFLWAGGTVPQARGRGAYASLLAARIERARELGLEAVGLYARLETSAPIVERYGFERHGPMTYWVKAAK